MKIVMLALILILSVIHTGFAPPTEWKSLFNNKDLSGWDTYLGPRYDEQKGDFSGDPIGLNNDPDKVFSVTSIDGAPAIRISGQHFGGISTKEEFENYHLQLQFKWGELRWAPRKDNKRDSGLLYHAVGPHAKGWFFWMCSEELQIQEGDCGDYWGVGGASVNAPAIKKADNEFVYAPDGASMIFGSSGERVNARLIKYRDGEHQYGQWNTVDLYVRGDTSVYFINNVFVNKLYKLRRAGENSTEEIPLTKGKIQLQSEGAEIYYRNIKIEPIRKLPDE